MDTNDIHMVTAPAALHDLSRKWFWPKVYIYMYMYRHRCDHTCDDDTARIEDAIERTNNLLI